MDSSRIPLISVVTLNYNQARVTKEFLESFNAVTYPHYEILVCDMGSKEDIRSVINISDYPKARLLCSPENLGFAGGNNWGISQAKGEFIFIVNNDTEVTPDLLEKLLRPFFEHEQIGVTCPKIRFWDQPNVIQYAGFNPMNHLTGRTSTVGERQPDRGQFDVSGPTHGAHGCAMLVKREVIEKVGMFPQKFFLYYEEWDWSARILKAGFEIWYTADALIFHKESMSVGKSNPMKTYYHTRNRILYMRRNTNFFQLVAFSIFFVLFTVPKSVLQFIFKKQFLQLRYFIKGAIWNLYSSSYSPVR
ncbi:MAG TPA: glycosyltransferase family 2 protein [Chitinophagaceae bacterium]|nr:glycosyltransferase family 2 protein [Chitinophagaceae bacterium]